MSLEWMAWTLPTATFFVVIAPLLLGMTIWELKAPSVARKGFLPIDTTRGDRFFIGLLGSAYINLAWLGLTGLSPWFSLLISVVFLVAVIRYG